MSSNARTSVCGLRPSGELDIFCFFFPGYCWILLWWWCNLSTPGASGSCGLVFCSGSTLSSWRIFLNVSIYPQLQTLLVFLHHRQSFWVFLLLLFVFALYLLHSVNTIFFKCSKIYNLFLFLLGWAGSLLLRVGFL